MSLRGRLQRNNSLMSITSDPCVLEHTKVPTPSNRRRQQHQAQQQQQQQRNRNQQQQQQQQLQQQQQPQQLQLQQQQAPLQPQWLGLHLEQQNLLINSWLSEKQKLQVENKKLRADLDEARLTIHRLTRQLQGRHEHDNQSVHSTATTVVVAHKSKPVIPQVTVQRKKRMGLRFSSKNKQKAAAANTVATAITSTNVYKKTNKNKTNKRGPAVATPSSNNNNNSHRNYKKSSTHVQASEYDIRRARAAVWRAMLNGEIEEDAPSTPKTLPSTPNTLPSTGKSIRSRTSPIKEQSESEYEEVEDDDDEYDNEETKPKCPPPLPACVSAESVLEDESALEDDVPPPPPPPLAEDSTLRYEITPSTSADEDEQPKVESPRDVAHLELEQDSHGDDNHNKDSKFHHFSSVSDLEQELLSFDASLKAAAATFGDKLYEI